MSRNVLTVVSLFLAAVWNWECPMVPDDNRSIGLYCLLPFGNGKTPGGCDDTGGFRERVLERREVEKRIYGV